MKDLELAQLIKDWPPRDHEALKRRWKKHALGEGLHRDEDAVEERVWRKIPEKSDDPHQI